MALVFTLCLLEKTAVIFSHVTQWCLILLTSCCWWVGICWYLKVFLLIFSNYANTNILFLSFILDFGNSEALCHPVQHIIDILWCIFSYSFSHLLLSYKICILPEKKHGVDIQKGRIHSRKKKLWIFTTSVLTPPPP